ncbi:MAG: cellobiose phosphorylase [Candidatus Omnitrophica bacterium]|nr:cellobiose phosphorylase [Candidatus Omnitrophota bacterium]
MIIKKLEKKEPKYYLDKNGDFVIENYNFSKPFANFFPGIAGKYGIPLWVFYVNRSQCIISFGTQNKDHSILEFYPANKAWHFVSSLGFRTFLKIIKNSEIILYEPFNNNCINIKFQLSNRLFINSWSLKFEEINFSLGIKTEVEFFTIPNDRYGGLVRILTLTNLKNQSLNLQLLDGLPQIIPYALRNLFLKKLSRTIEAWIKAEVIKNNLVIYKLDTDPEDKSEVIHIKGLNFYLSFDQDEIKKDYPHIIIEPNLIFSSITDFSFPWRFCETKGFSLPNSQIIASKTPCGFSFLKFTLKNKEQKVLYSIIGYINSKESLLSSLKRIKDPQYIIIKKQENKDIITGLQSNIHTESSSSVFDMYLKQTYLDNILRGGYPIIFKKDSSKTIFYIYARKHGDLERDYNNFLLLPTYFSQGNGNYRDINQNRRLDVWFCPEIEDENILTFFNLIQSDGFNPLVIKETVFFIENKEEIKDQLKNLISENKINLLLEFIEKPFTPGDIVHFLEEKNIHPKLSTEEFLAILLSFSKKEQKAEHNDGYWTDHWTYNLDLLDNYLKIYPEKIKEVIFEKKQFSFYDNYFIVKPRKDKYIIKDGKVIQSLSVYRDNTKEAIIKNRTEFPHKVRDNFGYGKIYQTTLINKLLCLVVNKLSSLDPAGIGIEMEADKPNWFDALNGLPHLLGSSICETFELKRLIIFIKNVIEKTKIDRISITEEIYNFLSELNNLLKGWINDKSYEKDLSYWDKSNTLKENYRQITHFGFIGKEIDTPVETICDFLNNALIKLDYAIQKAQIKKGLFCAYFINEVSEYEITPEKTVIPKKFNQKRLPLFLEAQMHALRLSDSVKEAKKIYKATKKSLLFDKKLKMYKVTSSLSTLPLEIGRCRAFPAGWLENESIWLHMEYKYLLEVLKKELFEEFYTDFKNVLIPFQNPKRYGRSILENSSFIVSSAFKDKKLIGNGFVARLSGSTAEMLEIWLLMNIGLNPFFLNKKNELNLRFNPLLAKWLFKKDGTYSFNFLGIIRVTYHNPKRRDTFGKNRVKIKKIIFKDKDNNPVHLISDIIPSPYAEQIRARQIEKIDIYLA